MLRCGKRPELARSEQDGSPLMQLGVFIPIGNNGWLISTTSPQYKPSFDLNRNIVEKAERFGFDFALSMIKLHGFGGPSQFWYYNLESFTLMAGLAAVTERIQLFATCAVLTVPPPFAARMAVTIDSISHGRFGINIISGWQRREYTQMGIWPGSEHYRRRYDYCAEYVSVMKELWATGQSDFKGDFFKMDDCRCLPMPTAKVPIICAAQSDAGTKFAVENADYNFCSSGGINEPTRVAPGVARLVAANEAAGKNCGALVLTMIIADETDDAAMAKWEHYKTGTDLEALASVARMLDELATVPGVQGVMLTFDDFVIGMEQFGTRIQPLMRCRGGLKLAA
jgi:pyrimidine oxygenase